MSLISLWCTANNASSSRVETPTLLKMFVRWCLTVSSLIANFCAMSLFGYPATMVPVISSSRFVSPHVFLGSGSSAAIIDFSITIKSDTPSRPTQYWPPITVRIPYGGGIGGVEHHSDSSEAYYMATPGLHVVMPATVSDAYGLLREAIASDDPVVFLEPKRLYWSKDSWNPDEPSAVEPIGRAVVRRQGRSATLITYGPSVPVCLEAAEAARAEGWDLEVVDLRSLVPFDDETVAASVRRTGRAVVVHESNGFGGPGGEIAARVTERCFHHLEAPVLRVAGFDIPYPPPMLERHHLPGVDRILDAVGRLQWEAQS